MAIAVASPRKTLGRAAKKDSKKKPSRIDVVLEYVKNGITDRRFLPGQRLPTENEIAMETGVSRTPVREAVKILDAMGVLEVRVGSGTYVRSSLAPSVAQILLFQLYLQQTTPEKLMEARRMIERNCAELAARRRTAEDLAVMGERIEALAECAERPDATLSEMVEADVGFHRAKFRATGNELVEAIANFVLDMVEPWIGRSLQIAGAAQAAYNHRLEYTMIEAGNAVAARESVVFSAVDVGMEHWLRSLQAESTPDEEEDS
jgi:GntR family transcriptional repressor for pyruvate dehydrogenase complex